MYPIKNIQKVPKVQAKSCKLNSADMEEVYHFSTAD